MSRRRREEAPGAIWHVVCQGNDRQRIVRSDGDRLLLVSRLAAVVRRQGWRCHGWCLLDTHLHLLVETPEPNLGRGMQLLTGWYARRFNLRHGREGHVFQGPFYAARVDTGDRLLAAAAYVALNPVLAGVCRAPEAYPWSSYRQTAGLERGWDWVTTGLVRAAAHPDPRHGAAAFRRIVAARLAEKSPGRDGLHPDVGLQPDVTGLQPRPRMLREGG